MTKYIRILIGIVVVLGLALLAKNQAAWAAQPADDTEQSVEAQIGPHVPLQKNDPCERENYRRKHPKQCDGGSVLPPDDDIKACQSGDVSVGGVATLDINNLRNKGCLTAHTRNPDPGLDKLPTDAGPILSDVVVMTLPPKGGNLKICFAVPPGEQANIYSSAGGTVTPLKTKVKNGIACADVKESGDFMLVGQ